MILEISNNTTNYKMEIILEFLEENVFRREKLLYSKNLGFKKIITYNIKKTG